VVILDFQQERKLNPKIIIIIIGVLIGFPILIFLIIKYPIILVLGGAMIAMFGYTWLKKKGVLQ